jgi:diaminohydroxyphosphoribosylaminopyrimidine deaminase/5-amino-6-(5-phosphoribosylamino)uracil reductase
MLNDSDIAYLHHALRIAARHQGNTAENPSVGCVLAREHHVVGVGVTGIGGRPHAETQAIASAGAQAKGATAYVTLEPCAHHGKTPPCAQALIDAGIARVVIACRDPDPRVNGGGIAMLQAAGIAVELHELPEARALLRGFLRRVRHGLPEVSVKIASSGDGFMASDNPNNRWITGESARAHGHMLRARHQAILTGIGTVLADNPQLTCRLPGLQARSPLRIVLDRNLRIPLHTALVKSANGVPCWVITTPEGVEKHASHASELREHGVVLHVLETMQLRGVLAYLGQQGIHRLLVEAGPTLTEAFVNQALADHVYWYRAPTRLNAEGESPLHIVQELQPAGMLPLAPDTLYEYRLASCLPD